jgi:RNase H-fold protein (predicted Holliday junction resolvase)
MKDDDHYLGAKIEEVRDIVQRMAEAMVDVPSRVRRIDERLETVEAEVKAIHAAVKGQTRELNEHAGRLTALEEAT